MNVLAALDCACSLYLNDPTAWPQPPTNLTGVTTSSCSMPTPLFRRGLPARVGVVEYPHALLQINPWVRPRCEIQPSAGGRCRSMRARPIAWARWAA
jgi:hypothetical protein